MISLQFINEFCKQNSEEFDYDPIHLDSMLSVGKILEYPELIKFCESEQSRFTNAKTRLISWEEFCNHQKKTDFWILVDNGIYDITTWITRDPTTGQTPHPGGTAPLQARKQDSTYFFEIYHATNECYTVCKN
jgi:cytochrome b involved in lipid metabolism